MFFLLNLSLPVSVKICGHRSALSKLTTAINKTKIYKIFNIQSPKG